MCNSIVADYMENCGPRGSSFGELRRGPLDLEYQWVPSSIVEVGENRGSFIFTTERPRHEVRVSGFWVSKYESDTDLDINLTDFEEKLHQNPPKAGGIIRLPTEAEWISIIHHTEYRPIPGAWTSDEYFVPRWGAPIDGRPITSSRLGSPHISIQNPPPLIVLWNGKRVKRAPLIIRKSNANFPKFIVWIPDPSLDQSPPFETLPIRPSSTGRRVKEELLVFLFIGALPSMTIALYNSPEYALSQPLNILLGGLFVSIFSGFIWRPRHPIIRQTISFQDESE